jgi:hypothetical protein
MKPLIAVAFLLAVSALFAADKPAVIGHLETKGRIITIWAGEQPRYSVRTRDGKALAESITLRELNAKFPDLRRAVDGSYATWAGL